MKQDTLEGKAKTSRNVHRQMPLQRAPSVSG